MPDGEEDVSAWLCAEHMRGSSSVWSDVFNSFIIIFRVNPLDGSAVTEQSPGWTNGSGDCRLTGLLVRFILVVFNRWCDIKAALDVAERNQGNIIQRQ